MDLNALAAALSGLGPWGIALGAALTLAVNFYRNGKLLPTAAPASPTAPVAPAPAPSVPAADPSLPVLPVIPNRPLLNAGLQFLQLLAQRKALQATAPVTPYSAAAYDPYQALEDEVLKRVAGAADPTK